jgi:hypothetical protein
MLRLKLKWGLILKAALLVLPLLAIKLIFHFLNLEVIAVGPVIKALVAGVFFVIAIILSERNELGNIKRLSNRVEVIKEVSFLPAGHAIGEFATGGALLVLLLLKIEPVYEGLVLAGVIATILISVVLLIKDMDNPFEGDAQIDLSHLHKLDKYLDSR